MTPEERAWCERIHKAALEIVGYAGAAERNSPEGSRAARLSRKAQLEAVAIATEACARIRDAEMGAAAAAPDRFDLAGLAALPMAGPELSE
jgi:hypothetical protein